MIFDLNKTDLINIVRGSQPNYSAMDHPDVSSRGHFDGVKSQWRWDTGELKKLNEGML